MEKVGIVVVVMVVAVFAFLHAYWMSKTRKKEIQAKAVLYRQKIYTYSSQFMRKNGRGPSLEEIEDHTVALKWGRLVPHELTFTETQSLLDEMVTLRYLEKRERRFDIGGGIYSRGMCYETAPNSVPPTHVVEAQSGGVETLVST